MSDGIRGKFEKPAKRGPKPRKRIARTVRPRAQRVSAQAAMEREAARLWSIIVRGRAGYFCEHQLGALRCQRAATDAAHARGKKAHPSTRYWPNAGVALCREHHEALGNGPRMRALYIRLRGGVAWEHLVWGSNAKGARMDAEALESLRGRAAAYR